MNDIIRSGHTLWPRKVELIQTIEKLNMPTNVYKCKSMTLFVKALPLFSGFINNKERFSQATLHEPSNIHIPRCRLLQLIFSLLVTSSPDLSSSKNKHLSTVGLN